MRIIELDYVLKEKMENILKNVDKEKRLFVWGYQGGGEIICKLLKQKRLKFDIIDSTYENNKLKIKKPGCLRKENPNDVIVFLCMKNTADIESALWSLGFQKDLNYFSMTECVYGDSNHILNEVGWLEYKYGIDISMQKDNGEGDCKEYVPTPGASLHMIMDSISINEKDALFDYGMGKGGVIIQFALEGLFHNLGGVERDEELYRVACENFKKLEFKNVKAICADARSVTNELDDYNYFFFYNPFLGSIFNSVLLNIRDSYERKRRRIKIIYINTFCHDMIMASGIFRLEKQIEVNHFFPLANVYTTEIDV